MESTPTTAPSSVTGKVADVAVRDDAQALAHGLLARDGDHRAAHDLRNLRLLRQASHQHHLARVVALADDPHQPLALHHQQRAHALLRHDLDGVIDGGVRRDRQIPAAFFCLRTASTVVVSWGGGSSNTWQWPCFFYLPWFRRLVVHLHRRAQVPLAHDVGVFQPTSPRISEIMPFSGGIVPLASGNPTAPSVMHAIELRV